MAQVKLTTEKAQANIDKLNKKLKSFETKLETIKKESSLTGAALENLLSPLRSDIANTNKELEKYRQALKNAENNEKRAGKEADKLGDKIENTGKDAKKAGKEFEKMGKKARKSNSGVGGLFKSFKSLLAAFGIFAGLQLFADIIRNTSKLILKFDSLRFAMQTITDSTWAYTESQAFLIELNTKFGAQLIVTAERWVNFRTAAKQSNLTLLESEKIFRSVTKAASVLGLNNDALRSSYLALEQMLSKGKITTEELRRQLGEKIPGAMGIMAAAIGVTIPKLDEMLKKGEVLSAEVLPDFADALEVAYGIQAVNKVETLQATIGRLQGAWQSFVNNFAESENIIGRAAKMMIDDISALISKFSYFTGTDEQKLRFDVSLEVDAADKEIEERAKQAIEFLEKRKDVQTKLQREMAQITLQIETRTSVEGKKLNDEEIIELRKKHEVLINELISYSKKVEAQKKIIAADGFDEISSELNRLKAQYDVNQTAVKLFENTRFAAFNEEYELAKSNADLAEEENKEIREKIVSLQAEYNVRRKLLEVQAPSPVGTDGDGSSLKFRQLKFIRDLTLEAQRAAAKDLQVAQERALEMESLTFDQRIGLLKEYHKTRNNISELSFKIEVEKAQEAREQKLKALDKPAGKNEILPSVEAREEQRRKIIDEANKKIEIAFSEHRARMVNIGKDIQIKFNVVDDERLDLALSNVEAAYNKQIIAINERWEASNKTNKDLKEKELALAEVAVDAANAMIEANIMVLESKLAIARADGNTDEAQRIENEILKLRAGLQSFSPPDNEDDWKTYFMSVMDYASEMNQAVGSIVDNLFARRIENINAEIAAEREKYDKLIELAENDEKEQEVLRRNKEIRIKQLEEKRLREEQKQAKARKAFAIADIAISTAQAIMGIWAQVPKFDFGISAGLMTAFVSALGAAQMAAVLAQPIPKYKDGGKIKKDETAMINDGPWKEYIERDGEIFTTNQKNAVVDLQKDDIVYKNYGDLVKKSNTYQSLSGGQKINEYDFKKYFLGIQGSVEKGFKKAKINNKVNVINQTQQDHYADKMTRWNG